MLTAVELPLLPDEDDSENGGHDDGYKRWGGADDH